MILYIAGPMTGRPNHNREAFERAAARLRAYGHEVLSPVEFDHNTGIEVDGDGWNVDDDLYEELLQRDFELIDRAEGVALLDGWERSGGVGREGTFAVALRKPLFLYLPAIPGALMTLGANTFLAMATTERRGRDSQPA